MTPDHTHIKRRPAQQRKTATIQRQHIYGTSRFTMRLMWHGVDLGPWEPAARPGHGLQPKHMPCTAENIAALKALAKSKDFTHVKFAGWGNAAPRGGKLKD